MPLQELARKAVQALDAYDGSPVVLTHDVHRAVTRLIKANGGRLGDMQLWRRLKDDSHVESETAKEHALSLASWIRLNVLGESMVADTEPEVEVLSEPEDRDSVERENGDGDRTELDGVQEGEEDAQRIRWDGVAEEGE